MLEKIIPSFKISLFESSCQIIEDLTEVGIDSLLDDDLLKSIPVVSLLVNVKKTAQNLHDRNLLRQTLQFIKEFNEGMIDSIKLDLYRNQINNNPRKAELELGRVLLLLNNTIELEKSKMLANLFRCYINESINWDEFCEFSEIIRNFYLSDLNLLSGIFSGKIEETKNYQAHSINRLKALGLIDTSDKGGLSFEIDKGYYHMNQNVGLTKIGGKFYQSILKN